MIYVALVDDQQLVRAGFEMLLHSQEDMEVVWTAGNGAEAIEEAEKNPVDIILMDIQMPVLNGIEATRTIIENKTAGHGCEHTKIIGLTTFDNDEYVLGALGAGASGFLLKDAQPEELIAAVRAVYKGESVISAKSTARLLKHIQPQLSSSPKAHQLPGGDYGLIDPLTAKEIEVTRLIAMGLNNQAIAEKLFISMATVKTHINRILAKTGSCDRVHIVLFALRSGLVSNEEILGQE